MWNFWESKKCPVIPTSSNLFFQKNPGLLIAEGFTNSGADTNIEGSPQEERDCARSNPKVKKHVG